MDNNLLFIIAAFIVGVIIGVIIRSATARGRFDELESRVRTLQNSADAAKRELTGVQSELNVRDSHINTLNSNIGILEEKTRRAELTAAEAAALIATAQSAAQQAGMDIPALKAELSQRDADLAARTSQLSQQDAELNSLSADYHTLYGQLAKAKVGLAELRAELDAVTAERVELQAGLEVATAEKGDLETQLNSAQAEADRLASLRGELDDMKGELDQAQMTTKARLSAIENQPRLTARLVDLPEDADPQLFELRDHLVRLTFAGALIAKKLDDKSRELDDVKANIGTPIHDDRSTLASAGLVASGYKAGKAMAPEAADDVSVADEAVAAVAPESPKPPAATESPASDLNSEIAAKAAEIESLKKEQARLQEDLQTTLNGKTELAGQLEKAETELNGLKTRIAAARAKVRELLSAAPPAVAAAAAEKLANAQAEMSKEAR